MQNQYTRQAERAIKYAARMARKLKHPYIGTEHLLLGLRSEITGVAGQVLASHGVDEEQLLHLMDELIVPGEEILQQDDPKESPRLEYILENAKKEALHLRTRIHANIIITTASTPITGSVSLAIAPRLSIVFATRSTEPSCRRIA